MGHLNGILARVGGNLNNNFQKSQMPGGGGWHVDLTDTLAVIFFRRHFELRWALSLM